MHLKGFFSIVVYLIGTNDKDLRLRLRKIPGVPLVGVGKRKYTVERLPKTIDYSTTRRLSFMQSYAGWSGS